MRWAEKCVGGVLPSKIDATDVATLQGIECAFSNLISVVLALAGIVVFVMLVLGGFKYMTSGGDPKATESAKGTVTHAIFGLVILIFAYVVLVLIGAVSGVDVTRFRIMTN